MKVQREINRQEFEEYKNNLLKIKNKYFIESMEIKKRLLADEVKMSEKKLRLHNPMK